MTGYVVEREKLEHNIAAVRERAGDAAVYAAVKADGYGVGCLALARVCESCGIKRFAVTSGQEAAALTRGGVGYEEILMLTPTSDIREIEELSAMGVTFTAASVEDARALSKLWYTCGRKPRAHIKLDTGMGRRGFTAAQSGELAELYDRFSDIEFTGIYTHLCSGYDGRLAKRQYRTFKAVTDALTAQGISVGLRHIASSAALFYQPQMRMDAVRVGSALFGRMAGAERFGLLPTGRCFVEIESVRTLPKGSTVG
ncbi:MAG: alanine racemase, partial [Oscillospiraceae bacterium]|nr:alanine racemase [Oscillospiraceae bacterium]